MDIFFQDPNEIPLPPEEVRIRSVQAELVPGSRRVRVSLEVDPFLQRPNAEVTVTDQAGEEVAGASIVEAMTRKMEVNLHLRQPEPQGLYKVNVILYYTEPLPEPEPPEEGQEPKPLKMPESTVVDRAETTFTIEAG